jgi:hypothetical protein
MLRDGYIYFRAETGKLPADYALPYTALVTGVTLYHVRHVRIENLVLTVPVQTPEADAFGAMLAFETLTLCPIDTRCIDVALMRADELDWLNGYHAGVRAKLGPRVAGDARAWLDARTEPLTLR